MHFVLEVTSQRFRLELQMFFEIKLLTLKAQTLAYSKKRAKIVKSVVKIVEEVSYESVAEHERCRLEFEKISVRRNLS
jgi:hypothetical protein